MNRRKYLYEKEVVSLANCSYILYSYVAPYATSQLLPLPLYVSVYGRSHTLRLLLHETPASLFKVKFKAIVYVNFLSGVVFQQGNKIHFIAPVVLMGTNFTIVLI